MAGGPDTPALAAAVSSAGGLGSLGCAYASPPQIDELARHVRALTDRPFALNLFVRADATEMKLEFRNTSNVVVDSLTISKPPAASAFDFKTVPGK